MAQISKVAVDKALRDAIFSDIFSADNYDYTYTKINDRQYGVILRDLNGRERYVRIGAIVAEERQDIDARSLMAKEIQDYEQKQAEKAEKAAARAAKAEADKAKREAKEGE